MEAARGDRRTAEVSRGWTKKPRSSEVSFTGRPGRNFRDAGFGVSEVWMNILRMEWEIIGTIRVFRM